MLRKLSKNAGAKLVIHDPALPPLPDEYGIDLEPSTASSIAIQTASIVLPPTYAIDKLLAGAMVINILEV
jgi:Amiloride-sensitive sodium channel